MRRGTALVTGATGGFGRPIVSVLARRGFSVYATTRDRTRAAELEQLAPGFDVRPRALDLTDERARQGLVDEILDAHGAVDVLVNNAGALLTGFVEDLADDELRRQMEINFFAVSALIRRCVPAMRERRHGRIVNVSSVGGRHATPAHGAYNASKFAVEGLSEALRYELVPYGVFVSLVEPGLYPTELFGANRWVARGGADPRSPNRAAFDRIEALTRSVLHHRMGADPADVAEVVARIVDHPRPRMRYPVGPDAWWTRALAPWVPAAWEATMLGWQRSP